MKIWIINHNAIPPSLGSQNRHYYFTKYLSQKGHSVKIITASMIHNSSTNITNGNRPYYEKEIDGVPYTFLKTRTYKGNGLGRLYNLLEFAIKIPNAFKYFELPDIVYTSSPDIFTAFVTLLLAKYNHIKCIVEIRDLWPESIIEYTQVTNKNPIIKLLYSIEKWIYFNADALVFTMCGGIDYINEKYYKMVSKFDFKKIYNVNNGVDLDEFDYNKAHYVLEDNELNSERLFKVIYTGAIRKVNNLQQLIDCAAKLSKYNDIIFLIYGTGTEVEILKNYMLKNNIMNVIFKGYVEKKYIPYILSNSDLNVVNVKKSNINRFGCSWNKLYEYFASAKPVLSNLKVQYDLISQYGCGMSLDIQSAEEYAEAVLYFYNLSNTSYAEVCRNSRETAKLFDYKRLSKQIESILLNTY